MATKMRTKNLKDSGIGWIGKIPQDWSIQKLKRFCDFQSGDGFPEEFQGQADGEIPFYKVSDINGEEKAVSVSANYVTQLIVKEKGWHLIQPGSILMAKIGAALAKNHRKIATQPCCIDNNMLAVSAKKTAVDAAYLYWQLKNLDLADFQNISSVPSVNMGWLKECSYPVPPKSTQTIFTDLLNYKTTAIDHAIEQKRKFTDLLKEKRTAIINRAVTRGLDENIELVDSGVEWIGKVPKGWSVTRLKYVGNKPMQYGANEAVTEFEINLDQPRFIRITDINEDGDLRKDTFVSLPEDVAKDYILHEGDLLLARSGATVGKTFKYKNEWGRCCFAGYLIRLSVDSKKADVDFIDYVFKSAYYSSWVSSIFIQATIQNVSAEKYKEFIVFLPSLQEQKRIITHLNQVTENINNAIRLVQRSIALLSEYRTSLVSHVVTGKVEVTS